MQFVINSDEDAVNAALRMARDCHYFITGEVRGACKIVPGHRLARPLVNEPFWIVKLALEPPPVKSRVTILSGVPDDLALLVTQESRVFNWPCSDDDLALIFSKTYVAGSSDRELVPSRSKKVTSASSTYDFGIEIFQPSTSVADLELPIDAALFGVAGLMPSGGFCTEKLQFADSAALEALAG